MDIKAKRPFGLGLLLALLTIGVALAARTATLGGDAILARAGTAGDLSSYSVPVHFDVHMHRPIGIKSGVDGVMYYKAPGRAALDITKAGLVGRFFKGSYTLDMLAQTWPAKYSVSSVSQDRLNDENVYVLQAVPKSDPSVDRVVFTVAQADYAPVSAVWYYRDGSSVTISIENQRVESYTLPATESIAVSMPSYSLDAAATYGEYALNAPVPDSVFAK